MVNIYADIYGALMDKHFNLTEVNTQVFEPLRDLKVKDLVDYPQVGGEISRLAKNISDITEVIKYSRALEVVARMANLESEKVLICLLAYHGYAKLILSKGRNTQENLHSRMLLGIINTPKKGVSILL